MHTETKSEITSKPDGQDISAGWVQTPTQELQGKDSKFNDTEKKDVDKVTNSSTIEKEDLGDSADPTNDTAPQSKTPSRIGPRSKRRRNKEAASPVGPSAPTKTDISDIKQDEEGNTEEMSSTPKQLPKTTALSCPKFQGGTSGIRPSNETKSDEFKNEKSEGAAESPVNKDEPDTAVCSSETKATIDKESSMLSKQEEKTEERSLTFTTDRPNPSEDRSENLASFPLPAPLAKPHLEMPPAANTESTAEQPKLDKELSVQLESTSKQEGSTPAKDEAEKTQLPASTDTALICQAENEDVEKLEIMNSGNLHHTEERDIETTQQLLPADKSPTKDHSGSRQSFSEKQQSAEESKPPETTCQMSENTIGSSALPVETQKPGEASAVPPEKAAICSITQTNEAVSATESATESDKDPQKAQTATDVPPESEAEPTESSGIQSELVARGGKADSVSVEKSENSLDDSCTHGTNDAGLSESDPITEAATPDEGATARGTNDTVVVVPAQVDVTCKEKTDLAAEELPCIFDSESTISKGLREGDREKHTPVPSVQENLIEIRQPALSPAWSEESTSQETKINVSPLKDAEKITQSPPVSSTLHLTGKETEKAAEKGVTLPAIKLLPVANGDISSPSQLHKVIDKQANEQPLSQTSTAPLPPEANRRNPDPVHHSSLRKLKLPKELQKDNSSQQQDTPSSWLDVDLDDDDFVEKIRKLCAPFSLPPRKHNHLRTPQPPFAMPAIKEDRFEKTFDPEEFTFGLRKKTQLSLENTPSLLAKLQSTETKSGLMPARVSFADRSILCGGLREKGTGKGEDEGKEDKEDKKKVKSRFETSSVLSTVFPIISLGQAYEIYRDLADASSLELSPLISVKVVRGCWILYEKPDFQGRTIALEEGALDLENVWAERGAQTEPQNIVIGSIRLAVQDYSLPHIDLFTEPEGRGRVTPYQDDTIETGSFGIPLNTASIQVHSGVWLVFSDPGFEGMVGVLEKGAYPVPESWGFSSPFVGSLRPLKMGGFKVENPNEVKAVVYEKPGFEGSCLEIDSDVLSFCETEGGITADGAVLDTGAIKSVGSLKIIGGFWVGYNQPGFEGQQHILEEGEYLDCSEWGGSELLSLRPIISDFLSPHLKLFSDTNFGKLGVNVDLTVPVVNMEETGYGMKTQSVDVISGVWVVFEEPDFCGEPYVLEKGLYGSPEDWGALKPKVGSTMPVVLVRVQLFSDPGFQGSVLVLEDNASCLQEGFSVASCKVLAGSWLAFEEQNFTGKMYVLEEGSYPDLRAMGCFVNALSDFSWQEFSLPSITLFERCGLRGKRVLLTEGSVNLQRAEGCGRVQSVLVEGGIWILYEGINYRGAQILLKPGRVPDWQKFTSWQKIGSLRPLLQKQVYFRLRNRQTRQMMTVTGDLDDVKLLRIQETEETDGVEQIWSYQNGHLHCKLLEECCLSPSGSVIIAGTRVGLTPELNKQIPLWSITPEGFIRYSPTSDLILEVKGGALYDKNVVILNTLIPNKLQQRWDVEII
uniref:Absent in melanoma 1 protein n=1 Tax=Fundulus heteroclitus TaxID=8078 RepID=A0A3Q2Q011_FUNHE